MQVLLASMQAASEELNYVPIWPIKRVLRSEHVRLSTMQSALREYNASRALVIVASKVRL